MGLFFAIQAIGWVIGAGIALPIFLIAAVGKLGYVIYEYVRDSRDTGSWLY